MSIKRYVHDKRNEGFEDVSKDDYIPFLGGRPSRESTISEDEVINLIITLNTARSMDEFLEHV
jgi:hypothetical protein